MKAERYTLRFLTPCLCAGAEQTAAELRAPSIRGKLRWWFRVLGGSRDAEATAFGSAAGENGTASPFTLRATPLPRQSSPWRASEARNAARYLLYFPEENGRLTDKGVLPPDSQFQIEIIWRRLVNPQVQSLFDLALEAFLNLGSLGLRSTRGLGCFQLEQKDTSNESFERLLHRITDRQPAFTWKFAQTAPNAGNLLRELENCLRSFRAVYPSRQRSPLGGISPRQASALHLRPVRLDSGLRILLFEAPAARVLHPDSRLGAPLLSRPLPPPYQPRGSWRR